MILGERQGMLLGVLLLAGLLCRANGLTVQVRQNGTDNDACLKGNESCRTFGWALKSLQNNISEYLQNVAIEIFYSHEFIANNATVTDIVNVDGISISGYGYPVLHCPTLGTGLAFYNCSGVNISGLSFKDCAVAHNTTTMIQRMPQFDFLRAYSTLFFFNSTNVILDHCQFNTSRGNGVSMYDCINHVGVYNSTFTTSVAQDLQCTTEADQHCSPQSAGLYIESSRCGGFLNCSSPIISPLFEYHLHNNTFLFCNNSGGSLSEGASYKTILNNSDHWPFGQGGGLAVFLLGVTNSMNIYIENTTFESNSAEHGGGMSLQMQSLPSSNAVYLEHCMFNRNKAGSTGGGLTASFLLNFIEGVNRSNIQIAYTNFSSNFASIWGGGVSSNSYYRTITLNLQPPAVDLIFTNCTWESNSVELSAAAMGLSHGNRGAGGYGVFRPTCFNCTFNENRISVVVSASRLYGYGALILEGVPMSFHGHTEFVNNSVSGLCVYSSTATLNDEVLFRANTALSGGAINMMGNSWLELTSGLNLTFHRNVAFKYGGAIYHTFPPSRSVKNSRTCFLQYVSDLPSAVSQWNVSVTFINNLASQAGNAMYISTPEECIWEMGGNAFQVDSNTSFHYVTSTRHPIATPPKKLYPDLSEVERSNYTWYSYSVMPGQEVNISFNVLDYFNISTTAVVTVKCHDVSAYINYQYHEDLCDGSPYSIPNSQRVVTIDTTLTGLQFTGHENSEFLLVIKTDDVQPLLLPILMNITECRFGYFYKTDIGKCQCYDTVDSNHIQCIEYGNQQVPCLQRGYWFGVIDDRENMTYGIQTCPVEGCSRNCTPCEYLSDDLWCRLPVVENDLCRHHRSGPLCSSCEKQYSLSYDAYECIKCGSTQIIGLVVIFVGYWLFMIFQVVVLVRSNYHIGSGYAYSVLYFFSVVNNILWFNLPSYLDMILNIASTFARLDPHYFAYTGFCIFPGATPVQYEALHFLHPLVIIAAVSTIAGIGYCFPNRALLSGETATHTICFLLLLGYTTLAESSLSLLLPVTYYSTYPHTDKVFVQLQPDTEYMHPTNHLPYAILAIFVQLFLVIPFALFLLLSPLLTKCFNLVKLKPFLDVYQSPFQDRFRWFAGVYLIGRQLFFLTILWNLPLDTTILLNQIFCVGILTLQAALQPYQSRILNTIDTLFLLDLTLLTLLYSNTGVGAIHFGSPVRDAFIAILFLCPCCYLLVAYAAGIYYQLRHISFCRKICLPIPLGERRPLLERELLRSGDFPPRLLEQEAAHRQSQAHSTVIKAPERQEGIANVVNGAPERQEGIANVVNGCH